MRSEQAKLTATYLSIVAVALLAVGGLAPFLATIYGTHQRIGQTLVGSAVRIAASFALDVEAPRVLRRLGE